MDKEQIIVEDNVRDIKVEFIPAESWCKRAKWKLLEEYHSENGVTVVPPEFITDGASIPPIFRMFFSPTGRYFGAAIVHDYILVQTADWSMANNEFKHELEALRIIAWRRFFLVSAVRVWGWWKNLIGEPPRPIT